VVGWGAYVGFLAVVLVASASLLRQPRPTPVRAPAVAMS
jgi:hypothetical protein